MGAIHDMVFTIFSVHKQSVLNYKWRHQKNSKQKKILFPEFVRSYSEQFNGKIPIRIM